MKQKFGAIVSLSLLAIFLSAFVPAVYLFAADTPVSSVLNVDKGRREVQVRNPQGSSFKMNEKLSLIVDDKVIVLRVIVPMSSFSRCVVEKGAEHLDIVTKGMPVYRGIVNADPVSQNADGDLVKAVTSFDMDGALRALNGRANPDQKINGFPLAVYAIKNQQPQLAMLLIDRGANVNEGDNNSTNALHWAAWMNYPELVEKCIAKKANINLQIYDGSSALMLAVFRNNEACVDILLKYNPNLDLKNTHGKTAAMLAQDAGFSGLVNKLANHSANRK